MKTMSVGTKLNRLTIVGYDPVTKQYNCLCDCGKTTKARGWAMKKNKHRSCGCLMKEEKARARILPDFLGLKNEIFRNYMASAKRRKYIWNLSKEEFFELLKRKCYYCGIKPTMSWYGTKRKVMNTVEFKYNGVDRVDNALGYTLENCVSCCSICNNAKATLTTKEFLGWVEQVYLYSVKETFNDYPDREYT